MTLRDKMEKMAIVALTLACATVGVEGAKAMAQEVDSAKIIVAHRGASGYLPEHTLESAYLGVQGLGL